MRGHVSASGVPGGRANCRFDCDGYRPDILEGGTAVARSIFLTWRFLLIFGTQLPEAPQREHATGFRVFATLKSMSMPVASGKFKCRLTGDYLWRVIFGLH